jgi:hypothetical protein
MPIIKVRISKKEVIWMTGATKCMYKYNILLPDAVQTTNFEFKV